MPGDTRTARQRNADAVVELAWRQMNGGGLPRAGGQRPHLVLTTTRESLHERSSANRSQLQGAGAIPVEVARRLACDAAVSEVVVDAGGDPLDAGRTRRTAPPVIRRALARRDGGCMFPRCDRPPDWTDAHHIEHWADRGRTSVKTMGLLCRFHHTLVHEGGWTLTRHPDGTVEARPP